MKALRRKRRRQQSVKRRPINVLASALTTMSLYMGVASIFASIGEEYETAAYLILGAIIFDMLDGAVARLTNTISEFGKQLDSLCDLVSFGVAPAVLVFSVYLQHAPVGDSGPFIGKSGAFVAIIFVICAALRLARFNTYQSGMRESFVGLPTPAGGATVASFVIFLRFFGFFKSDFEYYAVGALTLLTAGLMVSAVRYPKDRMKSFVLAPNHAFTVLGVIAFAVAVIHYAVSISPSIVLFPVMSAYLLFGIGDSLYTWYSERALPREAGNADAPDADAPPEAPASPFAPK